MVTLEMICDGICCAISGLYVIVNKWSILLILY